jgi:hypothetical protein
MAQHRPKPEQRGDEGFLSLSKPALESFDTITASMEGIGKSTLAQDARGETYRHRAHLIHD